jgi:hypothetical protein
LEYQRCYGDFGYYCWVSDYGYVSYISDYGWDSNKRD